MEKKRYISDISLFETTATQPTALSTVNKPLSTHFNRGKDKKKKRGRKKRRGEGGCGGDGGRLTHE
jgi:hypothetical protein